MLRWGRIGRSKSRSRLVALLTSKSITYTPTAVGKKRLLDRSTYRSIDPVGVVRICDVRDITRRSREPIPLLDFSFARRFLKTRQPRYLAGPRLDEPAIAATVVIALIVSRAQCIRPSNTYVMHSDVIRRAGSVQITRGQESMYNEGEIGGFALVCLSSFRDFPEAHWTIRKVTKCVQVEREQLLSGQHQEFWLLFSSWSI